MWEVTSTSKVTQLFRVWGKGNGGRPNHVVCGLLARSNGRTNEKMKKPLDAYIRICYVAHI
jgi:hypothetical protein